REPRAPATTAASTLTRTRYAHAPCQRPAPRYSQFAPERFTSHVSPLWFGCRGALDGFDDPLVGERSVVRTDAPGAVRLVRPAARCSDQKQAGMMRSLAMLSYPLPCAE